MKFLQSAQHFFAFFRDLHFAQCSHDFRRKLLIIQQRIRRRGFRLLRLEVEQEYLK